MLFSGMWIKATKGMLGEIVSAFSAEPASPSFPGNLSQSRSIFSAAIISKRQSYGGALFIFVCVEAAHQSSLRGGLLESLTVAWHRSQPRIAILGIPLLCYGCSESGTQSVSASQTFLRANYLTSQRLQPAQVRKQSVE